MTRNESVISVGIVPELLSLREAVLRSAGFTVFPTSDIRQAVFKIQNGGCRVLLVCYSIAEFVLILEQGSENCSRGSQMCQSPHKGSLAVAQVMLDGWTALAILLLGVGIGALLTKIQFSRQVRRLKTEIETHSQRVHKKQQR